MEIMFKMTSRYSAKQYSLTKQTKHLGGKNIPGKKFGCFTTALIKEKQRSKCDRGTDLHVITPQVKK